MLFVKTTGQQTIQTKVADDFASSTPSNERFLPLCAIHNVHHSDLPAPKRPMGVVSGHVRAHE